MVLSKFFWISFRIYGQDDDVNLSPENDFYIYIFQMFQMFLKRWPFNVFSTKMFFGDLAIFEHVTYKNVSYIKKSVIQIQIANLG